MNIVQTVDDSGRKRRYAINDDDDPRDAEEIGIDVGVPDPDQIDWESASIELSNVLYDMGLFTMDDVATKEGALPGAVLSVFKRRMLKLYKGVGQ